MLKGKVAVVTGASRGIGKAIATVFLREGASVVISGTNEERLQKTRDELQAKGGQVMAVAGDISDPATCARIVECAMKAYGQLDILVNNAGMNLRKPFLELEWTEWQRMMDVNLDGTFHMLKACLPVMVAQHAGSVVNISSSASKTPHATAAASYAASKGGMNALTRQLALEMARYSVRVNAVCPGPIETDMSKQWKEEYKQNLLAKIPLGRIGTPEDVAELTAFLASDRAAFITGETININGGTYMN